MNSLNKPITTNIKDIKTPSSVVHIKHSITLRQYKLWIVVLQRYQEAFIANELPNEDGFFSINREVLFDLMGYEYSKDAMRRDFETIRREPIILNYLEKGNTPMVHGMGFISEWKVSSKTIYFKVPSFLEKVIQGLDQPKAMFQLINWQIFNHFSGKHEAVIYKLCRDYSGVGRTPYMTIEEFREYMGLKHNEYRAFMELNRSLITNPVSKINKSELSDITITVELVKDERDGRKTKGVVFYVEKKHQPQLPFVEFEENHCFKFAKVALNVHAQNEYLAIRTPSDIVLCIERANIYGDQLIQKGKNAEYGAIYRKAITEGWHEQYADQKAFADKIEKDKAQAQIQQAEEQAQADRATQEKAELRNRLLTEFQTLPEDEQRRLIATVIDSSKTVKADYIRHGTKGAMFTAQLVTHLKKQYGID